MAPPEKRVKQRLDFYPFAYALYNEDLIDHCWYCLEPIEIRNRCLGCGLAVFCNKQCQTLGWKDHKAECKALPKCQELPDIEVRLLGRIVVREKDILTGKDKKDPNFYKDRTSERKLMDIWAHTEDIRKDKYAINKFQSIYDRLTAFYDERHMLPRDVVFEIHCRDYINRHAISDREYLKEIGKGLYLDMCAYDHSCRPNTVYTCKGFIATLRGLNPNVNLSDRSTTFYAYIELTCSLQQRKKLLKDTWYFDCQCERCTDKTDNLLTSVICPYCPKEDKVAVCIFGDSTYKNKEAKTVLCHKCNTIIPQDYIMEALTTMNFIDRIFDDREVEQMPRKTQLEFLEDLLARAGQTLPDVNVYLCKIIQNLIGIVKPSDNETLLKLHQKAEQCVRKCFPHNHPAVAFHLRNIGIFLQNIGQTEKAVKYLLEAQEILEFTLDKEHCMTMKNQALLNDALAELRQKRQNVKNGTENTENVAEQVVPEEEKPVPDQSSLENVVEISNELINAIEEKSLKKIEEVLEVPKVPKQENGSSDKNQSKKQKKQQKQQQNQANGNSKNEKSPAVESESGKVTDLTQISQPAKTEQLTQNGTEKETRRETKKVVVCDDLYSDNMDDLPELVQMSLKRDEDEYHGNGLHRPMEAHSSLSTIGHINYIRMFVSDRLQFPDEADEHLFGYKDLQEVQTIGQGSFAHVREMIHISTGRRMAVKRVRILGTGHDDTSENRSMKQLHKEVEAIRSASNCPQIVRFYGLTFHEGDGLVCMELMDISLHQLYKISHELAKEPFCETTLGAVAVATIRALQHLKVKHQIIHRDVKPSNILLSLNGLVKLCDFGICGYLEDSVNKTRDVGCRPYMAPERLSFTNRSYDSRSDVWSLGITLVEVANGEFPYKSFNTSPIFAQIQMVVYEDPPTIEPDHFSIKARNFVAACLVKEFEQRPNFDQLSQAPFFLQNSQPKSGDCPVQLFVTKMHPLKGQLSNHFH